MTALRSTPTRYNGRTMSARSLRMVLSMSVGFAAVGCLRAQLPHVVVMPGASQPELTWRRAAEMALASHPDLQQARDTLAAARHNRNQALGGYLPAADGSARRARNRLRTRTGFFTARSTIRSSAMRASGWSVGLSSWSGWAARSTSLFAIRRVRMEGSCPPRILIDPWIRRSASSNDGEPPDDGQVAGAGHGVGVAGGRTVRLCAHRGGERIFGTARHRGARRQSDTCVPVLTLYNNKR